MNEKTEELRDIFLDVADEETVTESQEEAHGSVTDEGRSVEELLAAVVAEMREKFGFETDLSDEEYHLLVESFYDGCEDEEIGEELSCSPETVFRARMDLHLVHDEDPPGVDVDESDWETIRTHPDSDATAIADQFGLPTETVERVRTVVETNDRARRASQRFRTRFDEILTDAELTEQFAADTHRDGLDDATEDAEVDVEF